MKMSGARIVLESLKREGVDVVFGLPGGAVLPIWEDVMPKVPDVELLEAARRVAAAMDTPD